MFEKYLKPKRKYCTPPRLTCAGGAPGVVVVLVVRGDLQARVVWDHQLKLADAHGRVLDATLRLERQQVRTEDQCGLLSLSLPVRPLVITK